jgi:hypothetical protein
MTPFSLDNLNQATAAAAAQKMAAVTGRSFDGSGEAGGPAGMEQRSLEDEERTLQVGCESLGRKPLRVRGEELKNDPVSFRMSYQAAQLGQRGTATAGIELAHPFGVHAMMRICS